MKTATNAQKLVMLNTCVLCLPTTPIYLHTSCSYYPTCFFLVHVPALSLESDAMQDIVVMSYDSKVNEATTRESLELKYMFFL